MRRKRIKKIHAGYSARNENESWSDYMTRLKLEQQASIEGANKLRMQYDEKQNQLFHESYHIVPYDTFSAKITIEKKDIFPTPNEFICNSGNEDCKIVHDFINDNISIDEFKINNDYNDFIIFYHKNTLPFIMSRDQIINDINNKNNIYYQCYGDKNGIIHTKDIVNNPYYRLSSEIIYYITLSSMYKILGTTHREWLLNPIKNYTIDMIIQIGHIIFFHPMLILHLMK